MIQAEPQLVRFLVADDDRAVLESYRQIFDEVANQPAPRPGLSAQLAAFSGNESPMSFDDSFNFEWVLCQGGEEAAEAVRVSVAEERAFAVAFVDVRMPPGPDGVWTAERMRTFDPYLHIVMVTAYSDYDPEDIARRVPPADRLLYIQKPFHVVEIRRFIWALSAKWRAEGLSRQMQAKLLSVNEQLKRDIAMRKQTEEQLAKSEERYRSLTENLTDVILQLSPNGTVAYCSPAAKRVAGYVPGDVVGRPLDRYIAERDCRRVGDALRQVLQSGQPASVEFILMRRDGSELPVEVTAFPIMAEGQVVTLQCVMRDVTERKQAEDKLRKSEASLAAAQRIAHLGNWDWDIEEDELSWSDETYRIFGLRPQGFGATHEAFLNSVHPDDRACVEESVSRALSGEKPYSIDHRVVSPDGTERIVHEQGEVSCDETGKPIRMVGTVQDITEWKQAEKERELLEQQLFQAQKLEALGTLASGVAHDFNNLLTSIIGMTELALRQVEPGSEVHEHLAVIPEQGRRAAQLIASLLTFSRESKSQPRPLALLPLVKEIGRVLERTLPEDIEIVMKWPEHLSAVRADPTQMQQIIMNLATNARDAMPDGGQLTIELAEACLDEQYCRHYADATPGDYVCLSVRDSGVGMTSAMQAHIFEPFFTTKRTGEGTGLGLAMVYGIVKNHEGHVHLYSEPGKGTEFKIYLPAVKYQALDTDGHTRGSVPDGTETLLFVEDEPIVLATGQAMLESLGYTILTAINGREALEIYRADAQRIDLILTDMTMPKLNGTALFEAVRKIDPSAKVILTSGYAVSDQVATLQACGVAGFVEKPFHLVALGKAVREALDNGT